MSPGLWNEQARTSQKSGEKGRKLMIWPREHTLFIVCWIPSIVLAQPQGKHQPSTQDGYHVPLRGRRPFFLVWKNSPGQICIGRGINTTPASTQFHSVAIPSLVSLLKCTHNSRESLPTPRLEALGQQLTGLGKRKKIILTIATGMICPEANTGP